MKEYRKKIGLSQKEVADKLGITQQAYGLKENRKRKFTINEALLLEEILGVNIRELFNK